MNVIGLINQPCLLGKLSVAQSGFYHKPTGFGKVGDKHDISSLKHQPLCFWIDGNCLPKCDSRYRFHDVISESDLLKLCQVDFGFHFLKVGYVCFSLFFFCPPVSNLCWFFFSFVCSFLAFHWFICKLLSSFSFYFFIVLFFFFPFFHICHRHFDQNKM